LRSCSTNFPRGLKNEKQTHDLANSTMSNPDGPTLQLSASEHLPYALYFSGDCPSGVQNAAREIRQVLCCCMLAISQ
jgi:hypothetical protein